MGPVAALLAMDRTTLTRPISRPLERRRLVKIAVGKTDRRSRVLVLTAAGRKLLSAAQPVWEKTHNALERTVGDPDRLRADLRALS